MDPKATLGRLFEAINNRDFVEAENALADLASWHYKGGNTPVIMDVQIDDDPDDALLDLLHSGEFEPGWEAV